MRYKLGAEQIQEVPSLVHRPNEVFRAARTGRPNRCRVRLHRGTVCGVGTDTLQMLDEDWEAACFVEKCPDCFAAVAAHD
jgi:hypothetical protein